MVSLNAFLNRRSVEKMAAQRTALWPLVTDDQLWTPNIRKGYGAIPRTMPIIQKIMDEWSKGKPVSAVYFALWCRDMGLGFVTIGSEEEMAFESGFTGNRAAYQWKERMKVLAELKFIDAKAGAKGDWSHILIWNPYKVLESQKSTLTIQEKTWVALTSRMREISAEDLAPPPPPPPPLPVLPTAEPPPLPLGNLPAALSTPPLAEGTSVSQPTSSVDAALQPQTPQS